MSYEFRIEGDGRFSIFNRRRRKVVYSGSDSKITDESPHTHNFENLDDTLSYVSKVVSLATYKKIAKRLCH
jgi:hypothetical protein